MIKLHLCVLTFYKNSKIKQKNEIKVRNIILASYRHVLQIRSTCQISLKSVHSFGLSNVYENYILFAITIVFAKMYF